MISKLIKYVITVLIIINIQKSYSEELFINASTVEIDKTGKIVYAKGNVEIFDKDKNIIYSDNAEYDKGKGIVKTAGPTRILTSEKYEVNGEDITYDDNKKLIYSQSTTIITDPSQNKITVDMFNYLTLKKMFFSKGDIEVLDNRENKYLFSEIYIDEVKNKIVGSDIKSYFNENSFKEDKRNDPRFFANSATITKENTIFEKGVFTSCKIRENDKCPPWAIRAKTIEHNAAKKTIYYENAVMKIYDFPVFYFPKFFHPDPTVKRQSGFLVPRFTDSSMVGFGTTIPYFWAMSKDKDMTIAPKFYANENIIIFNEYRQAFINSNLIVDTSYTEGYKKTDDIKLPGSRSHFFAKYNADFSDEDYFSDLEVNIQRVSNPTYLEVHDINTELVDSSNNILNSNINYEYQDDTNYLGVSASVFEDLKKTDRSKYEYFLPSVSFERNIYNDKKLGLINLLSSAYVKNVEVDQTTKMWVNDFNWKSRPLSNIMGIKSEFEGLLKIVNYEADADTHKTEGFNSEASTALAYNTSLPLTKRNENNNLINFFTPKISFRYAPGHMRNIKDDDTKLDYSNLFSLNKNSQIDVIEKGTSIALGLEFSGNKLDENNIPGEENYSFAVGQVYNMSKNNDIPIRSSLNDQTSDIVGKGFIKLNENLRLENEFSLDQNFNDVNYNEFGGNLVSGKLNFNLKYLEENNHIGSTNYIKSDLKVELNEFSEMNFDFRRNLETESTEFYSLAYNYLNDCLRAGVVFRRKFYEDRDLEHSDSLMFKISLIPLGDAFAPAIK
ncbi:MAG: hypothetical protein CBD56_01290 [Candidatus Pelagibacter sp. TMED196]|nr:MAG: hypothetical protein CBD56_01290 [Candidatus Pelagibacter sp. TMED196]|tara:strand:+ start:2140 stop:4482 length:2343 start_codon:yes stop_codon:yes gene_type:complete